MTGQEQVRIEADDSIQRRDCLGRIDIEDRVHHLGTFSRSQKIHAHQTVAGEKEPASGAMEHGVTLGMTRSVNGNRVSRHIEGLAVLERFDAFDPIQRGDTGQEQRQELPQDSRLVGGKLRNFGGKPALIGPECSWFILDMNRDAVILLPGPRRHAEMVGMNMGDQESGDLSLVDPGRRQPLEQSRPLTVASGVDDCHEIAVDQEVEIMSP